MQYIKDEIKILLTNLVYKSHDAFFYIILYNIIIIINYDFLYYNRRKKIL